MDRPAVVDQWAPHAAAPALVVVWLVALRRSVSVSLGDSTNNFYLTWTAASPSGGRLATFTTTTMEPENEDRQSGKEFETLAQANSITVESALGLIIVIISARVSAFSL